MSKTARLFLYCLIQPVFLTHSNRFFDICFECNLAEVLQFQSASCSLVTHFSFVIICPLMTPDHVCSRSNVGTEKGRGRVRQQDTDSCVGVSKTIIIHLKKTHIRYKHLWPILLPLFCMFFLQLSDTTCVSTEGQSLDRHDGHGDRQRLECELDVIEVKWKVKAN